MNMDWEFVVLEKLQQLHSAPLDFIMKCFAPFWLVIIFIALPSLIVMLIYPALLIRRILNEEKVLEEGLPGYREYEKKVKWRLLPFIW